MRGTSGASAAAQFTLPCRHPQQGVDLGGLLFNIHDFFLFLGVDEIRKRSSSDDKPLRMVKTILHELCKMLVRAAGRACGLLSACIWLTAALHKLCLVHVPGHAVELMAVAELAIGCAHWRVVPWHNQRLCPCRLLVV